MRDIFHAWLTEDRTTATELASAIRTREADELFRWLVEHRLKRLGPRLEALLERDRLELEALSPHHHLAEVDVPVYLLHGAHDSVIPPSETQWAARELASRPHRALVTPLIGHVEVDGEATWFEHLALLEFIADLL
jgi:pimeloyl-ACP methyl ester carboxylesterase